jgi:hypothetical protein
LHIELFNDYQLVSCSLSAYKGTTFYDYEQEKTDFLIKKTASYKVKQVVLLSASLFALASENYFNSFELAICGKKITFAAEMQ